MTSRLKYIQVVGDALIPLLGFYFWGWNLYFILLFYLADLLVNEVFTWVRSEKIRKYNVQKIENTELSFRLISLGTLCTVVILINMGISFLHPSLNHLDELSAFWYYEELGIAQGYILLPLLILIGYQQYRLDFLASGKYRMITIHQLWREHATKRSILLAVAAISCGVVYFITVPDYIVLWGIVTGAALYELLFNRGIQ